MQRRTFIAAVTAIALDALRVRADDLHARAAAAIAIHEAKPPRPPTAPLTPVEKPKAESRPVVRMYTATWCGPCQQAKANLRGADLPFDLQMVDVSNGGHPAWCDSIPAFAWEHNGQTRFILGFPGVKQLISRWETTRKAVRFHSAGQHVWESDKFRGYVPQWTWPGNLARHLQNAHRVNVSGMSQDRMEALHDALHEGRTIRA